MSNTNTMSWRERERVPQGSTLGPHNVSPWIGSVKLVGHNWDSHQNLSQWVSCSFKGNRHMIIHISRQWVGKAGQGVRKKGWTNLGHWERLGKEAGKILGNIWKEGKWVKGLGSCAPDRFWSHTDILVRMCQHNCIRCDTKTQYITTFFTKLSSQRYAYESKSQPYQNISIIHDTFVSDTWRATERRRTHHNIHITQQQTQCTSNTQSHIPPNTAAMVTELNPPTSWHLLLQQWNPGLLPVIRSLSKWRKIIRVRERKIRVRPYDFNRFKEWIRSSLCSWERTNHLQPCHLLTTLRTQVDEVSVKMVEILRGRWG